MQDVKMPDISKRRTIKLIGVAPIVGVPVVASAASDVLSQQARKTTIDSLPPAVPRLNSMQLDIQLIDTSAVTSQEMLIRNTTDEKLVVTQFMPGHVVFGDRFIDLQAALRTQSLVLNAGQSKSLDFDIMPINKMDHIEYVWADHAVHALSDETNIIHLGAFMANTSAVIYADTRHTMPS